MFLYSSWLKTPLHIRHKIAAEFGIYKKGSIHVVDNHVQNDGYLVSDIEENLTIQTLQNYLATNYNWQLRDFVASKDFSGKATILLDELDSHLDLEQQRYFHTVFLPLLATKFQVICISHSVFALKHKDIIWLSEKIEY